MKRKGLQKLTETRRRIMEILEKPEVMKADLKSLDNDGMAMLQEVVNERLKAIKGEELDKYIAKILDIITPESRNSMWEDNHRRIINEISKYIDNTGRMPTMFELMDKTGLSRQTLGKHLKEYRSHPQYIEHMEQFRFMGQRVLSKMFELAMSGNVRAARLYLEMVGGMNGNCRIENNYIQINSLLLTQESLTKLNDRQLSSLEHFLRKTISIEGSLGE
jgi:hypothetical protein